MSERANNNAMLLNSDSFEADNPFAAGKEKSVESEPDFEVAKARAGRSLVIGAFINNLFYIYAAVYFYNNVILADGWIARWNAVTLVSVVISVSFFSSLPIAWITHWTARKRIALIFAALFLHGANFLVFGGVCFMMLMRRLIEA